MAVTVTTTTAAVGLTDTTITVASVTNITAPNFQTGFDPVKGIGAGPILLLLDEELMLCTAVNTTTLVVSVKRGLGGTVQATHVNGAQVQIFGLTSDFPNFIDIAKNILLQQTTEGAKNFPGIFLSGSADAIPSTVPGFYVVKTAGVDAMTLAAPTAAQEGNIIDVWSDTTNAHTITATSLFANGTALKTTATFAAFRGAGVTLRACNLVWHVLGQTGITFS